jgi:putative tryptophan/tyrosine transport system substrate-binding protein
MKRRDFLFAIALVVPTSHALAQQRSTKRVAMVNPATKPADMRIGGDSNYSIIFEEMKYLGYVEGANLFVDRYSAEGRFDRFPEIAPRRRRRTARRDLYSLAPHDSRASIRNAHNPCRCLD